MSEEILTLKFRLTFDCVFGGIFVSASAVRLISLICSSLCAALIAAAHRAVCLSRATDCADLLPLDGASKSGASPEGNGKRATPLDVSHTAVLCEIVPPTRGDSAGKKPEVSATGPLLAIKKIVDRGLTSSHVKTAEEICASCVLRR
jgi:hypothetical protein